MQFRSQDFIERLFDLGASLLMAAPIAFPFSMGPANHTPVASGGGPSAIPQSPLHVSTSDFVWPPAGFIQPTVSSGSVGNTNNQRDVPNNGLNQTDAAIFSVVVRLPQGMSVSEFLDEKHGHVFLSSTKLRRALKPGQKMSTWLATIRRNLSEHAEATLATGPLLSIRPLALTLAQYGVVNYLIPQSEGPLRRNLINLERNPQYELSGESTLALICEVVILIRALATHPYWLLAVKQIVADQLQLLPNCYDYLTKNTLPTDVASLRPMIALFICGGSDLCNNFRVGGLLQVNSVSNDSILQVRVATCLNVDWGALEVEVLFEDSLMTSNAGDATKNLVSAFFASSFFGLKK